MKTYMEKGGDDKMDDDKMDEILDQLSATDVIPAVAPNGLVASKVVSECGGVDCGGGFCDCDCDCTYCPCIRND